MRVNSEAYHDLLLVKLDCPVVKAKVKVAVADVLPVDGVGLMGSDPAGE